MNGTDTISLQFEQALLQVNRIRAAEVFEACYAQTGSFEELEHITTHALERIGAGWESVLLEISEAVLTHGVYPLGQTSTEAR